jgi:DNA polymerase elongation subunit (family B)
MIKDIVDLTDVEDKDILNYIGLGYRSIFYQVKQGKGQIILLGYDKEGKRKAFLINHKSTVKYRVRYKTNERDIYGNYVATKEFNNIYDRKKFLTSSSEGLYIVEALRPESEFLHKFFDPYLLDPKFNKQPLRVHFIDIETEMSDQFVGPNTAENRINMITVYDTQTERYYTWSLNHAKIDFKEELLKNYPKTKFKFFEFNNNEADLLKSFIKWTEQNYPDAYCSWNGQAFDIPYIVKRIQLVIGKNAANKLSPVEHIFEKTPNNDNEGENKQADILIDISGVFNADLLILYRDKFLVAPALDGGYNLSNVGEHEEVGRKIEYDGTLKDLYLNDYQKFYEYNVRDVDIVVKLEQKLKLINLARQITGQGCCDYNTIYSSIQYIIGSLIGFAKTEMNGVIFQSYINRKQDQQPYEGAYVFPPVQGLYKGGIATIDFNSLYPNTITSVNISPETYIGRINSIKRAGVIMPHDEPIDLKDESITDFILTPAHGGPTKIISRENLFRLLNEKCIFTRNNTLLLKHEIKWGVISKWCRHFFLLRKSVKKDMGKAKAELKSEKIKAKRKELEVKIENLDNLQMGLKILINSCYGILANKFSPVCFPDLAQTITRQGKFCNISASKFITEKFRREYGDAYCIQRLGELTATVSGDTDTFSGDTKVFVKVSPER